MERAGNSERDGVCQREVFGSAWRGQSRVFREPLWNKQIQTQRSELGNGGGHTRVRTLLLLDSGKRRPGRARDLCAVARFQNNTDGGRWNDFRVERPISISDCRPEYGAGRYRSI